MKPKIALYLSNWPAYFVARAEARKQHPSEDLDIKGRIIFQLVWFSVFVNMLTGGDPREPVSSSIHKDRKSSWGAGFLINVIEAVDDDHGETSNNPYVGEGSPYDRELHGPIRVVLCVFWLAMGWFVPDFLWSLLLALGV